MSGICGVYHSGYDKGSNETFIRRMCAALRHRGPDGCEVHTDRKLGLGATLLDIAGTGKAIVCNEDKSIYALLDGLVCEASAWAGFLKAKGHTVEGENASDILPHMYEEFGEGFVKRLEGEFAIAIWDGKKGKVLLARDRTGHKPLFYHAAEGTLCFASEIKGLLADDNFRREPNLDALLDFLSFNYIVHPNTMFRGIFQVRPGHVLVYRDGNINEQRYWQFEYQLRSNNDEDLLSEELNEILVRSVQRRLVDVPSTGAFLSGGIDSSMVVGLTSSLLNKSFKVFSAGFEEEKYNELADAETIARHFGVEQHKVIIRPDMMLPVLEKLIWHHDSPFTDTSAIPSYFVAKLAAEHVKAVLTGDGPDQLFGGSGDHVFWAKFAHSYHRKRGGQGLRLAGKLGRCIPASGTRQTPLHKIKRRLYRETLAPGEQFLELRSHFPQYVRKALLSNKPLDTRSVHAGTYGKYADILLKNKSHILDSILHFDFVSFLHDDLMVKVDRMTMSNSLETYSPFLDTEVIEFAASIPDSLKLKAVRNKIVSKYILKKTAGKLLPASSFEKKKQGFAMPVEEWLKNHYGDYVKEVLFDRRSLERGYFNKKYVVELVNRFLKGETDYATGSPATIVALLTIELWHRMYMDKGH